MAHNGLALSVRSDAITTGAGGETTTCAAAPGFVAVDNADGPACAPPSARSVPNESLETADIDAGAPPCTDSARAVIPIASLRFILCPAIAPTQPAEFAIFPHQTKWPGLERRVDR